ncbi:hypothetical protein DMB38_35970 [Streptomyces sp. WAC 06738]|uniref:hypothetical protein n=1 Tax=Streptomyces sp. WAC 06738 TaxID=2203210 RepID=UPI000F7036DF|nr:hypothetical protein [Streptomyces sp. WAC 06738]AZM44427.1 hypothetical protein DMB38_00055 [Streptomyces sp. WAC 06738]AZM50473.1 hypothetical protein DMB38_35970 [Streptomyces sp. WAC 06738]
MVITVRKTVHVTLPTRLAAAEEIHAHLADQLNLALRRPGMHGGETALRILIDHLLFMEREPEAWAELQQDWENRGLWTPTGIAGALHDLFPAQADCNDTASVYAEFVHRRGWLKPDRVLTRQEYKTLTRRVRQWAAADHTWPDVTAEFGPPSVLSGGNNPPYGKTLSYLTQDPQQPIVAFHLWNGSEPGTKPWPPEHEQPLLLAARFGSNSFSRSLTFTPEGKQRKPTGHPGSAQQAVGAKPHRTRA